MPSLKALLTAAALLGASFLVGCGVQFGKYASSGSFFDPLEPDFGIISIDRGTPVLSSSETNQNLIAVVMWCPGLKTEAHKWMELLSPLVDSGGRQRAVGLTLPILGTAYRTRSLLRGVNSIEPRGMVLLFSAIFLATGLCDKFPTFRRGMTRGGILRTFQRKFPKDDFVAKLSVPFEVEIE